MIVLLLVVGMLGVLVLVVVVVVMAIVVVVLMLLVGVGVVLGGVGGWVVLVCWFVGGVKILLLVPKPTGQLLSNSRHNLHLCWSPWTSFWIF